jgi:uncharacterized protein (TIGR03067 family)
MSIRAFAFAALVLAGCSNSPPAASLAGRWSPVSAELGGHPFALTNFEGGTLQLSESGYEFAGDKGTYAILSTTAPAKMDIHGSEGPNAGRTIPAIYSLAGDQLTVCYQLGAGERPLEFTSQGGPMVMLVTYKRQP